MFVHFIRPPPNGRVEEAGTEGIRVRVAKSINKICQVKCRIALHFSQTSSRWRKITSHNAKLSEAVCFPLLVGARQSEQNGGNFLMKFLFNSGYNVRGLDGVKFSAP